VPESTLPNAATSPPPSRPPRWLSDDEQRAWRSLLEADRVLVDRLDRELQRDMGMSHGDYEILVRLSEAPDDRMRMSELADRALFSRSRLSHAIARLERLGWVGRESCPTDKRGMFAQLTPVGRAVLEAAAPCHVEGVRRYIFDAMTDAEVAQLEHLTTIIRSRVAAASAI
jgi:DNA-binding MarR family transcriptional regulator